MAKLFNVNLPDGMSTIKLDSQGHASVQYTVKNVSARAIDGRALLISIPQQKPPSGPVEKGWVKLDGKTDRHFDVDKEETFAVKISVPPKSAPGDYTFRLDAVWVEQPDQGDEGAAVRFAVPKVDKPVSHFPLWLIPVILVVLAGIGVGLWRLRSTPTTATVLVPNVVDDTFEDAVTAIVGKGLNVAPSFAGDVTQKVSKQDPGAGVQVKSGQAVTLTFPITSACPQPCLTNGQRAIGWIEHPDTIRSLKLVPAPVTP